MIDPLRARLLPWIVWLTTVCAAAWLWVDLGCEGAAIGFAAGIETHARAPEFGRIATIRVTPGQSVHVGDVLASLDDRPLEVEAAALTAERERLGAALTAARSARTIEHDADARALDEAIADSDLSLQAARAERAIKVAEGQAIAAQRRRLAGLVDARMADRRDLDALEVKRAAVDQAITGAEARIRALDRQAAAARVRRAALPEDAADLALRPLEAELAALDVRERALAVRREALRLRAPTAGQVVDVLRSPGELVEAGASVVSLVGPSVEPGADVVLCLGDDLAQRVRVGEAVEVTIRGADVDNDPGPRVPGRVSRLAPRVAELPPRCRHHPEVPEWGREAYVALDAPTLLVPGQALTAALLGRDAEADGVPSLLGEVQAAATAARAPGPDRRPRQAATTTRPRRRRRRRGGASRGAGRSATRAEPESPRRPAVSATPTTSATPSPHRPAVSLTRVEPESRAIPRIAPAAAPSRTPSPLCAATVATLALLAGGCLHAPAASPERSVATWHAMQAASGAGAPDAGAFGAGDEGAAPRDRAPALTAEQAYALALDRSPDPQVADARAEAAVASIAAARQLENPTLRVTHFDLDDAASGRLGPTLGLRAPIPRPAALHGRVLDARLAAEAAGDLAEAARRRLRVRIFRLFARLAWLRADLTEAEAGVEVAGARRRELVARVAEAVAPEVALARAEIDLAEAEDDAAQVRDELARSEAALARLVDPAGGPRRFLIADDELTAVPSALDPGALTERAIRERPELRAAERRADQAELSLRRERRAALPWPSWAQVNYYAGAVGPAPPVGFGVALELPLLSWNLGAIRSAAARVRERDLESRAEIAAVAGEVEDALGRLRRADARVHALQGELLPRVDAAAQRAAAAADAGALDVLEVLDLEARRIAARRLDLAARHERRGAVLDLEAAIGAPLGR